MVNWRTLSFPALRCHPERNEEPVLNEAKESRTALGRMTEQSSERDSSLRSLENHVIPAKAGIHCVPDQQWTSAFAEVTRYVIFIPLGGLQVYDHPK
jgi:hypothetical protein